VHATKLRDVVGQAHDRKVTWLELFFDLVFAGAVAQVASPLRDDYSETGLLRFALLFVLIWWAWIGHAVFSTRFDSDDAVQRGATLLQMFGVAVMAANARDALDSRSSAGFAAAYAVQRMILVFQYFRARHIESARPLTSRYVTGHGTAALLWLLSSIVPAPLRYGIWALAFAVDLGTPWVAVRHSVAVPPDAAHLPERFGLFTLILLGESVIAVMHGIEHQEYWSVPAASAAFSGMGFAFFIWWWYFDAAGATAERHVRSRRDAVRLDIWSFAHLPFYLGLVTAFVGIQLIVSVAPEPALAGRQLLLFGGALLLTLTSLATVAWTSISSACRAEANVEPQGGPPSPRGARLWRDSLRR
jgi:low temperature requirement protein LtrA